MKKNKQCEYVADGGDGWFHCTAKKKRHEIHCNPFVSLDAFWLPLKKARKRAVKAARLHKKIKRLTKQLNGLGVSVGNKTIIRIRRGERQFVN